jgi:prepilin-type N-terminal cleavage/methylation domain-containing protein
MLLVIRRLPKIRGQRGFTMLEMIVVLAVIAIMSAVLTPMVLNYVDDAKKSKVQSDVRSIANLIVTLTKDVQHFPMYFDGTKTTGDPDIELLQGPGADPVADAGNSFGVAWLALSKKDDLANHLVLNKPGGTANTKKYASSGRFFWKGPYVEQITEDPWGNRYLVNVKNGNPNDAAPGKVIWVLSAGPNGKIETDPSALTDSGPIPGGDDSAVRIR